MTSIAEAGLPGAPIRRVALLHEMDAEDEAHVDDDWAAQSPSSVAGRGRDLAAIVGPLETLNGPPETLTQTMWLGTAPD